MGDALTWQVYQQNGFRILRSIAEPIASDIIETFEVSTL